MLTTLGGVIIFVLGQLILKLVIEPVQELKKSLGLVSYILLFHQEKIISGMVDSEIANEIKAISAEIVSKSAVVIEYWIFLKIFKLPSKSSIILASQELNTIHYAILQGNKPDIPLKAIIKIGELLQLKTTYS
jgi:hypothetical protein